MPFFALLTLAASLFATPIHTLVLRDGHRIAVSGEVEMREERVVFTAADGAAYSLSIEEVDLAATETSQHAAQPRNTEPLAAAGPTPSKTPFGPLRIRVSADEKERLLRELASNHGGKPAPPPSVTFPLPSPAAAEEVEVTRKDDEWYWKEQAQQFEESVRQREEDVMHIKADQQRLEDQVIGLMNAGYRADQFSYQVLQLQRTRDSLPEAELALARARRALDQFRDNARRQGVLPGWLR